MPLREQRQHFRIEDQLYFDYKVLEPHVFCSDKFLTEDLLGHGELHYSETAQYFQTLDQELAEITKTLAMKEPAIAHYLNLLNSKIDYLARRMQIGEKMHLRKVNISLGGMSFKSKEQIKEKTLLKLVIYTKPAMIPIVINGIAVHSKFLSPTLYQTGVQFENLTQEQEQLLSQHIMLAQVKCRAD